MYGVLAKLAKQRSTTIKLFLTQMRKHRKVNGNAWAYIALYGLNSKTLATVTSESETN